MNFVTVHTCQLCSKDKPAVMFRGKVTCMECRSKALSALPKNAPEIARLKTFHAQWKGQDWMEVEAYSPGDAKERIRVLLGRERLPREFELRLNLATSTVDEIMDEVIEAEGT